MADLRTGLGLRRLTSSAGRVFYAGRAVHSVHRHACWARMRHTSDTSHQKQDVWLDTVPYSEAVVPQGFLVREGGLDPPRLAPHAPQTCLSASSSTLAQRRFRTTSEAPVKGPTPPLTETWCRRWDLNPHRLTPTAP